MKMYLIYVGALTSLSSRYNYRSWECEKIESFDPFDTSGSWISYSIYGGLVVRAGIVSSAIISWCADKVRHFLDCFLSKLCMEPFLIDQEMEVLFTSWLEYICSMRYYLSLSSLYSFINSTNMDNYIVYDTYCNILELYASYNFLSRLQSNVFLNLAILLVHHVYMYMPIYIIPHIDFFYRVDTVFYCSFISLNYSYLYLLISNNIFLFCIVGFVHTISSNIRHISLEIIGLYRNMVHYIANSVLSHYILDGFLLKLQCNMISNSGVFIYLLRYLMYVKIISYFLYSFRFFNYVNFSYFLKKISMLIPYNYFFFEIILHWFKCEQKYNCGYLGIVLDFYLMNTCGFINMGYSHFILSGEYIYDLVIPVKSYADSKGASINYHGELSTHGVIINRSFLLSFSQLMYCYTNLYVDNNIVILLSTYSEYYFSSNVVTCYLSIGIFNYLDKLKYLFMYIFSDFFIKIRKNSEVYLLPYFYLSSCISSQISMLYSYYVDDLTYFLTGTCCRVSMFLSRFRQVHRFDKYTFI